MPECAIPLRCRHETDGVRCPRAAVAGTTLCAEHIAAATVNR